MSADALNISIHSLRVEGDKLWQLIPAKKILFQSTPSVWRETILKKAIDLLQKISIHSLRVEGDCSSRCVRAVCGISIHSLRVEGDVALLGLAM